MPDTNKDQGSQPNNEPTTQRTGFSAEYVTELRTEAAAWRTKLRDTEAKLTQLETESKNREKTNTILGELTRRSIKADPSWIKIEDGQTPDKAVDKFLKDYPQFAVEVNDFAPRNIPKPHKIQGTDSNVENESLTEIDAIRKDPIAKAKLRDHYRALLAQSMGKQLKL